jgi:transcriptional regulator of aromatic amino acid metabolism
MIIDSGKGSDKNPFPLFVVVLSAEHTGEGIGIDRRLKLLIVNRGINLSGIKAFMPEQNLKCPNVHIKSMSTSEKSLRGFSVSGIFRLHLIKSNSMLQSMRYSSQVSGDLPLTILR